MLSALGAARPALTGFLEPLGAHQIYLLRVAQYYIVEEASQPAFARGLSLVVCPGDAPPPTAHRGRCFDSLLALLSSSMRSGSPLVIFIKSMMILTRSMKIVNSFGKRNHEDGKLLYFSDEERSEVGDSESARENQTRSLGSIVIRCAAGGGTAD